MLSLVLFSKEVKSGIVIYKFFFSYKIQRIFIKYILITREHLYNSIHSDYITYWYRFR